MVFSSGKKAYAFIELRLSLLNSNLESCQVLSYSVGNCKFAVHVKFKVHPK